MGTLCLKRIYSDKPLKKLQEFRGGVTNLHGIFCFSHNCVVWMRERRSPNAGALNRLKPSAQRWAGSSRVPEPSALPGIPAPMSSPKIPPCPRGGGGESAREDPLSRWDWEMP